MAGRRWGSIATTAAIAGCLLAGCGSGSSRAGSSPRIAIRPATVRIDQTPSIRIAGLHAGGRVRVTASTPRAENIWSASASYTADRSGVVDLAHARPFGSAYLGTTSLGLLGVQTPGASHAHVSENSAMHTTFRARVAGRSASAALTQLPRAGSVRASEATLSRDGFVGRLFTPAGHGRRPAVVVWGGSEGGLADTSEWAQAIASHGIPALAVAYFDAPGLSCSLNDIPLGYFARAICWMRARPGVDAAKVWLLSASRGTEAELLVAAHWPGLVHGFVAAAPSSTGYGSIAGSCRPRSPTAWTLHGRPVPYGAIGRSSPTSHGALDELSGFVARLHSAATSRTRIPISGFRGPVLLLAGSDDQQWPSPIYSAQIMRELRNDPAVHQRRVYPGAGHLVFGLPSLPEPTLDESGGLSIELGGTEAADDAAHRTDWPLALGFIRGH